MRPLIAVALALMILGDKTIIPARRRISLSLSLSLSLWYMIRGRTLQFPPNEPSLAVAVSLAATTIAVMHGQHSIRQPYRAGPQARAVLGDADSPAYADDSRDALYETSEYVESISYT